MSVLFVDLVGFTSFAEGRDPERVRTLQQQYFDAATDVVTRHGGTVEKFVGDAVMAVWGTPVAHEDDAQRAVRAALEIVRSVEVLGHDLTARAGVVTGEAAVTLGASNQGMVAGDKVNTAARIQAAAMPRDVLVDQATMQAATAAIAFERVDDLELKGKGGAIRAWRALRVQQARAGELVEAPFVGRAFELRRLKELLQATGSDRRIRLVSIVGPAGIGKTRLVEELRSYAHGLAETTFWHTGRSPSYGERLAFWALGEMVRRRTGLAEGDDEMVTRERIGSALAEFVPSQEERAWIEPALLTLLGVGDATGSESLFPAWRTFFERIAERGSVVLVFEDLQWADSGTLEFINHLLDWSRSHPILVITLTRPELLDANAGWGTGRSNATAMALEPLPDGDMQALLEGLLPGVPVAQLEPIVRRAEGMPLYAVEMVRALVAEGRLERLGDAFAPTGDLGHLPLPASLRSLIASRLDALEPDDRALLQHGSVLGQAFSVEALSSVIGRPAPEFELRLRGLVRREFLEIEADPRSPERGQYRFLQSLIREVAYDTLAMRDRRARHLAAAQYLEASESDEAAGALASHYLAAYLASDEGPEAEAVAAQARVSLRAAAERAASLGAHEQAVRNLDHAISLTENAAERATLLEAAGRSAVAAALPGAAHYVQRAIDDWNAANDATAAGRASALLGESLIYDNDLEAAYELLVRETAALRQDTDPEVEARLYSSLSRAQMRLDKNEDALETADRSLRIAERAQIDDVTAATLVNKGGALTQLGRPREAASLIRGGMELASALGLGQLELRAAMNVVATIVDDDPAGAREIAANGIEKARRIGEHWFVIGLTDFYAGISLCVGTRAAWDDAIERLDAAMTISDNPSARWGIAAQKISFVVARGDDWHELMDVIVRDAALDPDPMASAGPRYSAAEVALVERDWSAAIRAGREALEMTRFFANGVAPIVVHAATRLGERETIEWVRKQLYGSTFVGAQTRSVRARTDAAIAAMDGDAERARDLFSAAMQIYDRLGLRWEWARTALDMAVALPGDSRVRSVASEARKRFDEMGAAAFVSLIDDLRNDDLVAGRPTEAVRRDAVERV